MVTGRSYKTEGIVLRRANFGEADRIVTLYTKHYGKVSLVAKGIRRLTSRKRGDLEIFNRVKLSAVNGRGMDLVTETETLSSFISWRKNLKKVAAAYEICEILDRLTPENTEQEEIYDLLFTFLNKITETRNEDLAHLVDSFGQQILRLLGFWPKDKPYPSSFSVIPYVEEIIEKELKSKKFLNKI